MNNEALKTIFRVGILKEQKDQQRSDLNKLDELKSILEEGAERLGVECEECKDKQEEILKRYVIDSVGHDRI